MGSYSLNFEENIGKRIPKDDTFPRFSTAREWIREQFALLEGGFLGLFLKYHLDHKKRKYPLSVSSKRVAATAGF
jgi:hypothetical protein